MFLIMMNIFLAILGEAYTVIRAENDEIAKARVKTKRRSLVEYLKLVRAVIRAKGAQRKAKRQGKRAKIGQMAEGLQPSVEMSELANGGMGDFATPSKTKVAFVA